MSAEKILPCPFCGAPASVEETENGIGRTGSVCFSVGCDSTDEESCMGYQSLTTFSRRSDAIAAWNKRAPQVRDDEPEPEPCTQEARARGCTCSMESVNSASIDPPEPVRDLNCPLHGNFAARDPDAALQQQIDDARDFPNTRGDDWD